MKRKAMYSIYLKAYLILKKQKNSGIKSRISTDDNVYLIDNKLCVHIL